MASFSLTAGIIYLRDSLTWSAPQFYAADPSNVWHFLLLLGFQSPLPFSNFPKLALLFPGETRLSALDDSAGKNSVWALYCRSRLLWLFCVQNHEKLFGWGSRALAADVWKEVNNIEADLDKHTCSLERRNGFLGRMYLHGYVSLWHPDALGSFMLPHTATGYERSSLAIFMIFHRIQW